MSSIFVVKYQWDWLSPTLSAQNYYLSDGEDVQLQTNVNFLGRFKNPVVHARLASSTLWHTDTGVPQPDATANIRVQIHDVPLPSLVRSSVIYYEQPATDIKFVPTAETNIYFLGKFAAPVYARFAPSTLWHTDTAVPQPETPTHVAGRFNAITHRIVPALRQNVPFDQTETQPHFLGRHTALAHRLLVSYRQNEPQELFVPPQAEAQPHFLGRFKASVHARFNFNTWDTAVPQVETNTNFIGRFSAVVHRIIPALRQNITSDSTETNPHFIGRYTSTGFTILALHRQNVPSDINVEQAGRDWIGRFVAQVHSIRFALRQNEAQDPIVAGVPSTEPHFLGRFTPPTHRRFNFNTLDTRVPVTDIANPHWIGRFTAPRHSILPALRQLEARDVQLETNVSFVGRFKAQVHAIQAALRQNAAVDLPAVIQAETNVQFLGRFQPTAYKISILLRQNPAVEVRPDVPPHFLGKHVQTQHRLLSALRQNIDAVSRTAFTAEAQPHFLGRHRPATHAILPGFRQAIPLDIFVTPETQPHFLGRFAATRHEILALFRQNPVTASFIPTTPGWVFPLVEALAYIQPDVTTAYGVMPSVVASGSVLSSHSPNPIESD